MKSKSTYRAILSVVLLLSLLMGLIPAPMMAIVQAKAEIEKQEDMEFADALVASETISSGKWRYRLCQDGNAELLGYTDTSVKSLELPKRLDGLWVVRLSENAFEDNTSLQDVVIPASISHIPSSAFPNCDQLTIRAYNGTAAMRLASERGLAFENRSQYDFFEDVLDLSDIEESQWSFSGSILTLDVPYATLLHEGTKVFLPPSGYSRTGFAVRTNSIEDSKNYTVARVEKLSFEETVSSYHVKNEQMYIDSDNIRILSEGFSLDQNKATRKSKDNKTSNFSKEATFNIEFKLTDTITIKGIANLSLDMDVSVDYHDFSIDKLVATPKVSITPSITVEHKSEKEKDEMVFAQTEKRKIPFAMVPVFSNGAISGYLSVYMIASASAEVTFSTTFSFVDTIVYEKGVCHHQKESVPSDNIYLSCAAEISYGIGIKVDLRIGWTIGKINLAIRVFELAGEFTLEAAAEPSYVEAPPPCYDISVGFHFEVSCRAGLIDWDKHKSKLTSVLLDHLPEGDAVIKAYAELILLDKRWPINSPTGQSLKWHWEGTEQQWTESCTREKTYTATFNFMYDGIVKKIKAKKGESFIAPDVGSRSGYRFLGWYDPETDIEWKADQPADEDIFLYAKWELIEEQEPEEGDHGQEEPVEFENKYFCVVYYGSEGTASFQDISDEEAESIISNGGVHYDGHDITVVYRSGEPVTMASAVLQKAWKGFYDGKWHGQDELLYGPVTDNEAIPVTKVGMRFEYERSYYAEIDGITIVTLPEHLKTITRNALSGCPNLTEVYMYDEVEEIGAFAFAECPKLSQIRLSKNLKIIRGYAFFNTPSLVIDMSLPYGLSEMSNGAFYYSGIRSVTIPGTVEIIPEIAFAYCKNLKKVTLSEGIIEIGDYAISKTDITELVIPSSVETIGKGALYDCEMLETLEIKESNGRSTENGRTIWDKAFYGCHALSTVVLPKYLEYIGELAFAFTNLGEVEIPGGVKMLDGSAFYEAPLTRFIVPDSVEIVGNIVIGTDKLKELYLPDVSYYITDSYEMAMEWIENCNYSAFIKKTDRLFLGEDRYTYSIYDGYKSHVTFSHIEMEPKKYGNYYCVSEAPVLYLRCANVEKLRLPEGVFDITGTSMNVLQSLNIPGTVKSIGGFERSRKLSTVNMPEGLFEIHSNTFSECHELNTVNFPDSITEIGEGAFDDCHKLFLDSDLFLPRCISAVNARAFGSCLPDRVLIWDGVTSIYDSFAHDSAQYPEVVYVETLEGYPATWFSEHCPDALLVLIDAEAPTVTFNAMGGVCETASVKIDCGETVAPPKDPVYDDYDFLGWFVDSACTEPWDFETRITENITLYAGWGLECDYEVVDGSAYITKYYGSLNRLIIPSEIDGYVVRGLREGAIPNGISIVSLPSTMREVEPGAFRYANDLKTIDVPLGSDSYTSLNGVLFHEKELVCYPAKHVGTSYTIPEGTERIACYSFSYNSMLSSLYITDSVRVIEDHAFDICENLNTVRFAHDVDRIGDGNFMDYSGSLNVYGPVGAEVLEAYADSAYINYNIYYIAVIVDNALNALFPVRAGWIINLPDLKDTETRKFQGWATDSEGEDMWTGCTMPEEDLILYGILKYEFEYEETGYGVQLTKYNGDKDTVVVPMVIDGFKVVGIADDCFPNASVTLVGERGGLVEAYANTHGMAFIAIKHTLSFDSNGGTHIPSQEKEATEPLDNLPAPVKDAYDFAYWQDENGNSPSTMPEKDLTLKAVWTLQSHYEEEPDVPFTFEDVEGGLEITGYIGTNARVVIPETINGIPVIAIADSAFIEDAVLNEITLPASVKRIGASAFEGSALANINMSAVEEIDARAFYGCKSLTNIALPDSLQSIGSYAFQDCYALLSVAIPSNVKRVETGLFQNCEWVAHIQLPEGLEIIGDNAFKGCRRLENVTIGTAVEKIATNAFDLCDRLNGIAVDIDNPYYSSIDGVLFNKSGNTLIRYPEGKSDTEYQIPDGVTMIAQGSMRNCKFEKLVLSSKVIAVGANALQGSRALSAVTLNEGLEEISKKAFSSCLQLSEVTIPDSVVLIDEDAFALTGLSSISIPKDARVGKNAVPENKSLAIYGFRGSDAESYALAHNIRFVDLSADVPVVDITMTDTPIALKVMESAQFNATLVPADTSETDIVWTSSDSSIARVDSKGMVFGRKAGSATIKAIAANGATASRKVTIIDMGKADFHIPSSLTEIGEECFMGIDATFVIIPASCQSIGSRAFADCENLEIVYFSGDGNVTVANDFLDGSDKAKVYAPEGSNMANWVKQ